MDYVRRVENVLENTPDHLLREILIIDDQSTVPVSGWEDNSKVRILRTRIPIYSISVTNRTEFGISQCTYLWWK